MVHLNQLIGTWRLCHISPAIDSRNLTESEVIIRFCKRDVLDLKSGTLEERFRISNNNSYRLKRFAWRFCLLKQRLTIMYKRNNQLEVFILSYVDHSAMIWKEPTKQLTLQFSKQ